MSIIRIIFLNDFPKFLTSLPIKSHFIGNYKSIYVLHSNKLIDICPFSTKKKKTKKRKFTTERIFKWRQRRKEMKREKDMPSLKRQPADVFAQTIISSEIILRALRVLCQNFREFSSRRGETCRRIPWNWDIHPNVTKFLRWQTTRMCAQSPCAIVRGTRPRDRL